jgi:hypothetical protein
MKFALVVAITWKREPQIFIVPLELFECHAAIFLRAGRLCTCAEWMRESDSPSSSSNCLAAFLGSTAESEHISKLSPETARHVTVRMEQEMAIINQARARLEQAMNDEILHMKQRILYDICGRIQEKALSDTSNVAFHQETLPDLFGRFPQKGVKKQLRKKPRMQKLNSGFTQSDMEIPRFERVFDLNGRLPKSSGNENSSSDLAVLLTRHGQKWLARKSDAGNGVTKLLYCDGSSSLVTEEDAKTLGLSFLPVSRS